MNIVIIGLGSMGRRRIRLIKEMYPDYRIIGMDNREDRRKEAAKLYGIEVIASFDGIFTGIDCAFVCTSPLSHAGVIRECLSHGWDVFTELNLVDDGYDENIKLAAKQGCHLFLSSTLFYREEIKYIRSHVSSDKRWNYIYHIGQYLPDWHPWENYKDFFAGDKRTNGCREILAIEFPWLTVTFGTVANVYGISDKMTDLDIKFNDNYMIQIIHENGNKGILVVDIVSPCAVRKFEVYAQGSYLSWGGTPDSICEFDSSDKKLKNIMLTEKPEHKEGYSAFIVENAYKNEIREFFDFILREKEPLYGFSQDKAILKLIDSLGV